MQETISINTDQVGICNRERSLSANNQKRQQLQLQPPVIGSFDTKTRSTESSKRAERTNNEEIRFERTANSRPKTSAHPIAAHNQI